MFRVLLSSLRRHPVLLTFIVLLSAFLTLLPYGLQWGLQKALIDQGMERVDIEDIDFNPFNGQLKLTGFKAYQKGDAVVSVKRAVMDVRWRALWQQRLLLETLRIQDGTLQVLQDADRNRLYAAGFQIPIGETEDSQAPVPSKPLFLAGVDSLDIHNLNVTWLNTQDASSPIYYQLDRLSLNRLYMWNPAPAQLKIHSFLNGSPLNTHFRLHLFDENPKVVGTLKTEQLTLDRLPYLAELGHGQTKGTLTADLTFTAELTPQGLNYQQQGDLLLKQIHVRQDSDQLNADILQWNGSLRLPPASQEATLYLSGTLQAQGLSANEADGHRVTLKALNQVIGLKANIQPDQPSQWQIEQQGPLTLTQLHVEHPQYAVDLPQVRWQGRVTASSDTLVKARLQGDLDLKRLALDHPPSQTQIRQDVQSDVDLTLQQQQGRLQLAQTGSVKLNGVTASQPGYAAALETFLWQGRFRLVQDGNTAPSSMPVIENDAQVSLDRFRLQTQNEGKAELRLQSLQAKTATNKPSEQITFHNVTLSGLELQSFQDDSQADFSLQKVTLDQAKVTELSNLAMGRLTLTDSRTRMTLTEEGKLEPYQSILDTFKNTQNQPSAGQKTDSASAPITGEEAAPAELRWQAIDLTGQHRLDVTSRQFARPIHKQIQVDRLHIGQADSSDPERNTDYELKLHIDEFSEVTSQGQVQPFNPQFRASLTGQIRDLNLTGFSPATAAFVGYDIQSGSLSAQTETHIEGNRFKADNRIQLQQLELKTADPEQSAEFQKGLDMPLDAALSLLKDKQGNIDLTLPIEGDLDDPKFQLHDVINTALTGAMKKATKTYLLLALQPYGAIALAGDFLKGQIETVRLQPIVFPAGGETLNTDMQAYLKKVAKLLEERPKMQLKVCPTANEADRIELLKRLAATASQSKEKPTKSKTLEELVSENDLSELAQNRGRAVKRFLNELGSEGARIIVCQPEVSKETGQPETAIGF